MNLNALSDFILVALHGGLGKASRVSGISKATLSRRIIDLEDQLGVRLIERSARGLRLTEAGESLMARTEGLLEEVKEAMTAVGDGVLTPRGRLRIAAPVLFSQLAMGRISAEFCALYPDIEMEVVAEDRLVDLVEEQFDVVIRNNPSAESQLVGRCFARDRLIAVASPELKRPLSGGTVQVPSIVTLRFQDTQWVLDGGAMILEPIPKLRLSSLLMVRDAVIAGGGVALLPESIALEPLARGELIKWGSVSGADRELWVLHTSRRLTTPKVHAFVSFMCDRYKARQLILNG